MRNGETHTFEHLRDDWLDSFIDSTRHFVRCILDDEPPMLSGARGREVLQFAVAAIKSARTGREIRPDEVVGQKIDD